MLDLEPESGPTSFDPMRIDEAPDSVIDALPFGVIALDPSGVVQRYNLYESRLARLDKSEVIGRSFFDQVARCTRVEGFQGRFRRLLASGQIGGSERFEFVFGFVFGEQRVSVEMTLASASRVYLLINRKSFGSARTQAADVPLAVAQRDLAPDEASLGVRRDELERRFVQAPAPFFAALRATCDRVAPESWQVFASEWGVQWGRRAAIDLEAWALEQGQPSLHAVPMRTLADALAAHLSAQGWGTARFDFALAAEGLIVIDVQRSALAESAPRTRLHGGAGLSDLSCHLLSGWFSGVMSHVADRRLTAREILCKSGGAPHCVFGLVAHERRRVIDAVLQQGVRGIEAVREALRRAPPPRSP